MHSPAFRSRIDPLLALLVFVPLLGVCGLVLQRVTTRPETAGIFTLIIIALSVVLMVWMFVSTTYRFKDSELVVKCGPFRRRVPVASIRRVTRTRTLQSAPALSLQRLEIAFGSHETVIISPKDEVGFLAALQARVPTVQLPPVARK